MPSIAASKRFRSPNWTQGPWSSSTTWPPTTAILPPWRLKRPMGAASCSGLPAVLISTLSKWPSRNPRRISGASAPGPSISSSRPSATSATSVISSRQTNAGTSSTPQDMPHELSGNALRLDCRSFPSTTEHSSRILSLPACRAPLSTGRGIALVSWIGEDDERS